MLLRLTEAGDTLDARIHDLQSLGGLLDHWTLIPNPGGGYVLLRDV